MFADIRSCVGVQKPAHVGLFPPGKVESLEQQQPGAHAPGEFLASEGSVLAKDEVDHFFRSGNAINVPRYTVYLALLSEMSY